MTDNTEHTQFIIYELPDKLTNGYCFGEGKPIVFKNIDWFTAPEAMGLELSKELVEVEIKKKQYIKDGRKYLVLSNKEELTFVIGLDGGQFL